MRNIIIALVVLAMCGASAFAAQAVTNCTLTIDKYVAVSADATALTTITGGGTSATKDVNATVTANCAATVSVAVTQGDLPSGASVSPALGTLPGNVVAGVTAGTVTLSYSGVTATTPAGSYAHTLTVTVAAD